jgi:hypothetical protein
LRAARLLWLVAWLVPAPVLAQDSLEYAVKATYLYKFAPFVEWPERAFDTPASPYVVCVAGDDPFGPILDRATAGQSFGERPVMVRRTAISAPDAGCHTLYTASPEALAAVRGRPVLTVTDAARGDAKGIVNFVLQNNRVRFEIDLRQAADNGLPISSKLLTLATQVRR